ncbi:MAG TPA: NADH-quinone oxidoreductase subunit J [Euzebyales bacterium]|nr:NADH-quinone oxidoreductase subunit J [Euzebyales bacterium]
MSIQDFAMLGVGIVGGASALLVVMSRNVVHAALYLVVTLLAVAGTFLLLGAEFLAWAQVLVYVGAVVVLILFGLMLTRAPIGPMPQESEVGPIFPLVPSVGLFGVLAVLTFQSFGTTRIDLQIVRTSALAEQLYVVWAFPFMVLGFFLTVALIGAIVIARQEEGEGPLPDHEALPEPSYTDATSSPGPVREEATR